MTRVASVAIVLALLGIAVWWLRRAGYALGGHPAAGGGRRLAERVGRLPLGPHHRLELVRLADRVLVVAVHASGCSLLQTLDWSELAPDAAAPAPGTRR